ncbi:MAG TPA: hypothetical protein VKV80_20015 [Streptosporangiaceae bacterium]|nr:hypothetical protein [Streptosporangiaceae bacterium]
MMAILAGQAASSSTAPSALCLIPPGACSVVLTATGGTAVVGPTPASGQVLGPGNGLQVVPGAAPTSFSTFPGSRGTGLSFVSSAAATVTVSYLISTEA